MGIDAKVVGAPAAALARYFKTVIPVKTGVHAERALVTFLGGFLFHGAALFSMDTGVRRYDGIDVSNTALAMV